MPYTVDVSFDKFYDAINLDGDHRETANSRKDRIVQLLNNDFEILEAFSTGSIPKFTALKNMSDLDVMVILHYGKHIKDKTPSEVLEAVRKPLAKYKTGVRRNGQAVTLFYDSWPNVDIVPVSRSVDNANNVTHYNVPDANSGNWIQSRPKEFAADIESKASTCGANFRRIIKMIKWWNSIHGDYLQSYHIEVLALEISNTNLDDTPWNVFKFFYGAYELLASKSWYDRGYADEYLSDDDREEIRSRIATAKNKSRDAWYRTYGDNNDHKGAIGIWKQVFGDKFPAYG